jgi:hypothetical protein
MLADWSRLLRWTLCIVFGFFALARPMYGKVAWAGGDDDDDDSSASSGGGDDDDGGGGAGGDDDDSTGDDDADQPAVTAGGLYTKQTYPLSELQRPLTITGGMTELRAGINIDASNTGAFSHYGVGLNGRYGFADNAEGLVAIGSDLNDFGWQNGFTFEADFEGSISYDLVDFRGGLEVTHKGGTHVGIPFGFPFRYAPKPQVGIVALEHLMTIDFDSKPDFTPEVAIVVQPIPPLAIKLHAGVDVVDFNFSKTNLIIPVSADIQYSPSNLLDFGGEFSFPNLKPPPDMSGNTPKFYDSRALLLYLQLRV